MKKQIATLLSVIVIIMVLLCGCSTDAEQHEDSVPANEQTSDIINDVIVENIPDSDFVGEWICLRENSCNNMEIILTITQENGKLKIVRDMESGKSSGSKISFSVSVPQGDSFSSSNTNGTYKLSNGILTESFDGGKVNYFSATGDLTTHICQFPFCSDESGDAEYCDKHDTEEKRYASLSDSQKKSIGYFIDGRYDYYDELNGGYSGDKYSDTIMQEAAVKYGLTTEHISIIWMKFYEY